MDARRRYSNPDITDINFLYGFCDGNTRAAAREYHRRYPNRRTRNYRVFMSVHRRIPEYDISALPSSRDLVLKHFPSKNLFLQRFIENLQRVLNE
ncbi:hypothetical protein EVAR_31135_1 [Eumeta japonica]|uniref:DUF4817 domain-containing protein n=1 Tax=Eumeta variegata TaxID=151549 RepID=A0A4C1VGT7_EUMVA|nr:hypothetical protein EVAR_31135_1 [Eumeta japonica]